MKFMGNEHINNRYTASSKTVLLSLLVQQNIEVPARTKSKDRIRRRIAVQRRVMFRALATLAQENLLSYPLELFHQDKPDFLLCYDGHKVGIECVEAVSKEWAETDALMESDGKHVSLSEYNFKIGTPRRTASERRSIIQNRPCGAGWGDDGMERDWALGIYKSVSDKTNNFKKPGFQKYDKNWLLIWSNLPGVVRDTKTAMEYLTPKLKCYWPSENRYDKLLIDIGKNLVEIQSQQWKSYPIPDLWT